MGAWKIIGKNIREGILEIELYNLEHDIGEEKNLVMDYRQIVKLIEENLIREHKKSRNPLFQL